ncbi:unnamed protein product [Hermetia illucens]|uniref:Uncharacterized protein n=1 Tax=Hermetia illucens TaxID=343691 RepID=A0A7R8UGZ5_HERIL|nr:uncharacterized protein LOC119647667 [Hermetia illucens]CAD7080672.1 unnamed protein product [Hermetia illucens]
MGRAAFTIIICLSVMLYGTSASPDMFLETLSHVKAEFKINLFVTVCARNSPSSNQLLGNLHESLSVQIVHFSDGEDPSESINHYTNSKIILEKLQRNFLLIAAIDERSTMNAVLKQVFRLTRHNRNSKMLFLSNDNVTMTTPTLKGLFRRCFDWGLIDVVLIQSQDPSNMFTYNPFDDFQIVKLNKLTDIFTNKLTNLNNYQFKVLVNNSPPRVMQTQEGDEIIGYVGHSIGTYIIKRNATVKFAPRRKEKSVYLDILEQLESRQIDFLWGLFPLMYFEPGDLSYPVTYEKFCVAVPVARQVPTHKNFLQPFQKDTWVTIIIGIVYITIVIYIVALVLNRRRDISTAFIASISFIISRAEVGPLYNINRWQLAIYLLLFLLGFILSNFYCALLTTFLTSPSYEREIKTLSDISAAHLKILGEEMEMAYLFEQEIYKEYHPLLRKLSSTEYIKIRFTLNNTNAVLVSTDTFGFMNDIQRYQNDIKFTNSKMCPMEFHLSALFKKESPFIDDFNNHALLVQQSGLLSYWKTNILYEALQSGYIQAKRGRIISGPVKLTLMHMRIPFYVLLSGLTISTLAFFGEKLYFYCYFIMYTKK